MVARSAESEDQRRRPNVVVILLDDVGFGAAATFGGPVRTPTLDSLAATGLRYNRFHTTAICSPTRASLLTGRDSHATGVGHVLNSAFDHPAYKGVLRPETAGVARLLQDHGYATACIGKWHLAPAWECSQAGPFTRWPTGQGFDHFYGFLGGETHQFEPTLYRGTAPVDRPDRDDYHLTEDLVDSSISWIRQQQSLNPNRPFFLYLTPGATHAPLHVPSGWAERYRGRFDHGWDRLREETLEAQVKSGAVPEDTQLTPRPAEIPAWADLDSDEQLVAARLMEVYAGFLEHTDVHLGRLITELEDAGLREDTLVCYVVGDNGSSAEGGLPGSMNYMGALQGLAESTQAQVEGLERLGTADSYPQYPAGWAWAMTAPFQWMKQIASHLGGTRNPMVLNWPSQISDGGGLRSQFSHVNDLTPTILDIAGVVAPDVVDGVAQLPMDGVSLVPTFANPDAGEEHHTQYFEVNGHRSIYHRGWLASAHHGGVPWGVGRPMTDPRPFDEDVWELYDLRSDFSQAIDLADKHPEKLVEMRAIFDREAARVGILPLQDARISRTYPSLQLPKLSEGRTSFRFYPGTVGVPESQMPRLFGRSWHLRAVVEVQSSGAHGVVATMGGRAAGWALWLDTSGQPRLTYRAFEADRVDLTGRTLAVGVRQLEAIFRADAQGSGGRLSLIADGEEVSTGTLAVTPRYFSIDETFDIGLNTGSPVGEYPVHFPIAGAVIESVDLEIDG